MRPQAGGQGVHAARQRRWRAPGPRAVARKIRIPNGCISAAFIWHVPNKTPAHAAMYGPGPAPACKRFCFATLHVPLGARGQSRTPAETRLKTRVMGGGAAALPRVSV